jgi:hypothetical protein
VRSGYVLKNPVSQAQLNDYLEIGFKTPSSVAGFNFLNPFLKIRELLVFVVYYNRQG